MVHHLNFSLNETSGALKTNVVVFYLFLCWMRILFMMDNNTIVEASPIKTIKDLLAWSVVDVHPKLMGKPLSTSVKVKGPDEPKTLVCHDMRGNYLEDKFPSGCPVDSVYYVTQWWYMDVFVYFSHNLVTIPPVGWINAAHLHGVSVLGTFITEFDDGFKICDEFLSDRNVVDKICRILADIALVYQFDGWLLNIENEIQRDSSHMENLLYFVSRLTELCKSKLGKRSLVIWYDSVTTGGELKWQNELNELNKPFFDLCNGIFLNYTWNETNLATTVTNAQHRRNDIYVGVDVFGRNCYGGGGYNCRKALQVIKKYQLSTAIFAPAWVFECLSQTNFEENQWNFWSLLAPFLECSKINSLPFETNFNPGKFYCNDSFYYNMSNQNLQPHWFCSTHCKSQINKSYDTNSEPTVCPKVPGIVMRHLYHRNLSGFVFCIQTCPDSQVVRLLCCDIELSSKISITLTCSIKQPNDYKKLSVGLLCTVSSCTTVCECEYMYLPQNGNKSLRAAYSKKQPSVELPLELKLDDVTKSVSLMATIPCKENARLQSINVVFGEKQMYLRLLKCSVCKCT